MAQFKGIRWTPKQMQYLLSDKKVQILPADATGPVVSKSMHYGIFLAFEGIRFFCHINKNGKPELVFLNWDKNLERFRKGIAFNLSQEQQTLLPTANELIEMFLNYFRDPAMVTFLKEMAASRAQGYLRPFTMDEEQSIGVTFSGKPSIRAIACSYDSYLGEPFNGVVIPHLVRTIGINGTGCLKLGVNYLMSVKAIEAAQKILPGAAAALFLDDNYFQPAINRKITEWDSSCCLIALKDGTVIKIPESNLILPSITILGVVALLRQKGINVIERDFTYGELLERTRNSEIVTVCSIGTAGIINRCQKLVMTAPENLALIEHNPIQSHELYPLLGEMKELYWKLYLEDIDLPEGMQIDKYEI